jgi:hypothetical protein
LCLCDNTHKNVVEYVDDTIWAFLHNQQEEICVECLLTIAKKNYDKTWEVEDDDKQRIG